MDQPAEQPLQQRRGGGGEPSVGQRGGQVDHAVDGERPRRFERGGGDEALR